ncbi:hypothetical protein ACFL44_01270 [Gemmatimonadota bacterium]
MAGKLQLWLGISTAALQPERVPQSGGSEMNGDVLWLLGGGVLALLALGFILTRRTRQRISEPVFDSDRSGEFDDSEEYMEPLL